MWREEEREGVRERVEKGRIIAIFITSSVGLARRCKGIALAIAVSSI